MLLRKILYDIDRGKEDKFPRCCIAFYSLLWGRLSDLSQVSHKTLKIWSYVIGDPYNRLIKSDKISWGRMPCPKCVLKDKLGLP